MWMPTPLKWKLQYMLNSPILIATVISAKFFCFVVLWILLLPLLWKVEFNKCIMFQIMALLCIHNWMHATWVKQIHNISPCNIHRSREWNRTKIFKVLHPPRQQQVTQQTKMFLQPHRLLCMLYIKSSSVEPKQNNVWGMNPNFHTLHLFAFLYSHNSMLNNFEPLEDAATSNSKKR